MNGVFGWLGVSGGDDARGTLARMAGAAAKRSFGQRSGAAHALGACDAIGHAAVFESDGRLLAVHGRPVWGAGASPDLAETAQRLLNGFAREDVAALLAQLNGDFALALIEPTRERAILAVDRMSVRNIVYRDVAGALVFGPTCDAVARFPGPDLSVDPQRIFDYLYFHMVPGPATIYRGVMRVPPAHFLEWERGKASVRAHWKPRFVENPGTDFAETKRAFRQALDESVRAAASGPSSGAFLSGGTDSSTISGLLGAATGAPARTFSIGFQAEGYDEMAYARIAATHFGTRQHEYYVTPQDIVDAVPLVAAAYDQPYGNASAVPTYYCARLARQNGVSLMLGGDGGDELFGGNARYARQYQFAWYERIPAALREHLVEPLARNLPLTDRVALLRKVRSYVAQASQPMPDRYESYNLLERLGLANIFTPDFLAGIDPDHPLAGMREVYAASDAQSLVNRMLALDFQYTLADNDLPKVTRMCELAGVDVAFPMLDARVIDLSLRVPSRWKLRGTELRWFFKESLKDFLPAQIITKEKHGFGLPVGAWLQSHAPLRALAGDHLAKLRTRGIIRPEFIDELLDRHLATHAGYYGTMVWVLLMLELWFQRDHQVVDAGIG